MIRVWVFAIAMAFSSAALAEPWLAYGQTALPYGAAVDNPPPNTTGAANELAAWPYTVPNARQLCVTSMAVEAYNSATVSGIVTLFLMVGDPPFENGDTTATVASNSGTTQMDTLYCWPAGTVLHLRIANGQQEYDGWVYGWQILGELTP